MRHLKHLFIDEFQDVSPEIVDWLAKTLGVHVRDGGEEVSVTCIGDDY
jgi:superfamily I DNA/RNA helicase